MSICKSCRYAINPYKDPFTGKTEFCCGIAEPIIGEFGDQIILTSNFVTSCEGFEARASKHIEGEKNHD